MVSDHTTTLSNGVKVQFFPEQSDLETMVALTATDDFLRETEIMKSVGCFPPFSLLVYEKYMVLGLCAGDGQISVAVRDYSQERMVDWIDMALSLRKHQIRVVDKTDVPEEFMKRLEPRTRLDWIEYDPKTETLREIPGSSCPAQQYLERMPLTKDLYALAEYDGEVEVVHMQIRDNSIPTQVGDTLTAHVQCEGMGKTFYTQPISDVERLLRTEHPDALVIREPLIYCSHGTESVPWSCLAVLFERAYAKRIGFKGEADAEFILPRNAVKH